MKEECKHCCKIEFLIWSQVHKCLKKLYVKIIYYFLEEKMKHFYDIKQTFYCYFYFNWVREIFVPFQLKPSLEFLSLLLLIWTANSFEREQNSHGSLELQFIFIAILWIVPCKEAYRNFLRFWPRPAYNHLMASASIWRRTNDTSFSSIYGVLYSFVIVLVLSNKNIREENFRAYIRVFIHFEG